MRDKMERLVLLPFAVGCMSESSVAVGVHHPRKSKPDSPAPIRPDREAEADEEVGGLSSEESMKNSFSNLPKPNVATGIHRLFKGFKNFSHLFVYKEDMEDEEMDIEIGLPTDVKHITHIGWDGCTTTNPINGWASLMAADQFSRSDHHLISSAVSNLMQFEHENESLVAQAGHAAPLANYST